MIVYNITNKVRWNILEAWLEWQIEDQIPAVLATGFFDRHQLYKLLEQDEEEGPTFVIQYITSSVERYGHFAAEYAQVFQRAGWDKWGDGFIAFRTLMESVQ
jgi:Domain of unknown function (DUF4286)